ncbi:hypothetical protein TraAM80_07997 [Trypanosoma rangeli]|uniref:Uncharacterized protein n=1 Tax=Trypanosoma rangeli TaxID=5698 RepID=A0A422N2W4_TRYRA|nr:uncharacterized protein TraAM80_07997 [Trypanosoma rangeli]RNE99805.1 hypothetical protein TraAM80_07997 [Trypanosoma rangeli]|eukprot:RNE99805.1 hypothetical protein TraAM80_07997 [Trypanosoma rangeli]
MKRERPFAVDDENPLGRQRLTDDATSFVEEVETVEETHTVLVRLPCLDFFRDAHICEEAAPHDTASAADEWDERGRPRLSAGGLMFRNNTLETAHPIVVIRTQAYGEMEFEGSWSESHEGNVFETPSSNRVVVQLCERNDESTTKGNYSMINDMGGGVKGVVSEQRSAADTGAPSTGVEVASLLKHPSVGITADEARGRQKARNASWCYDRIDVPCATLVLRRVK